MNLKNISNLKWVFENVIYINNFQMVQIQVKQRWNKIKLKQTLNTKIFKKNYIFQICLVTNYLYSYQRSNQDRFLKKKNLRHEKYEKWKSEWITLHNENSINHFFCRCLFVALVKHRSCTRHINQYKCTNTSHMSIIPQSQPLLTLKTLCILNILSIQ